MFKTTAWTLLETAGEDDTPEAKQAREAIWLRYYDSCHTFFFHRLRDKNLAEDYNHSFWLRLWENWEPFKRLHRGDGRFRNFLARRLEWFANRPLKSDVPFNAELESDNPTIDPNAIEAKNEFFKKYNRQLIKTAFNQAIEMLRDEDKGYCVEICRLQQEGKTLAEIGTALTKTEDQVRYAVEIMKARFERCVQIEVAFDIGKDPTSPDVCEEAKNICDSL